MVLHIPNQFRREIQLPYHLFITLTTHSLLAMLTKLLVLITDMYLGPNNLHSLTQLLNCTASGARKVTTNVQCPLATTTFLPSLEPYGISL